MISQAGAVAVRSVGDELCILLVRAKKNPEHWILPKGHVEPGETESEAAVRELREEAGIQGQVIAPLGALEFPSDEGVVHAEYFLVGGVSEVGGGEDRETRWCTLEEALRLIIWEDTRDLVRRAVSLFESQPGR